MSFIPIKTINDAAWFDSVDLIAYIELWREQEQAKLHDLGPQVTAAKCGVLIALVHIIEFESGRSKPKGFMPVAFVKRYLDKITREFVPYVPVPQEQRDAVLGMVKTITAQVDEAMKTWVKS